MKKITVLGSTGSIGTQTLEIVREYSDRLRIVALAAGKNTTKMEEQIREFHPKFAVMWDEKAAKELKQKVMDTDTTVLCGMDGLISISTLEEIEIVVTAIVGMIGIRPTIAAIEAGKDIALANKETLVTAGHIIMPLIQKKGVKLLPVDSEHSAIFQSLNGEKREQIHQILLTASGGPFRGYTTEKLKSVTVEKALKHPNWAMGSKITIDSSTMVNKGLEVMEAAWLFGVTCEDVKVVVHPESIVHSMVEYKDGAVIAQMGLPDMKLPIQYALFYPDRLPMNQKRIDFSEIGKLHFEEPDMETFRGLKMAYEASRIGGSMPTVYNAANEKAVSLFLNKKISFLTIYDMIEQTMEAHNVIASPNVCQILETEAWCYDFIESRW